jgi:hypothetical protein
MELEVIVVSEVHQAQKDKSHFYVDNKKLISKKW